MENDAIINELRKIADANGGILRASDVVDAAKNKKSPLHSKFEWDDSEAAHNYRLWQARHLISVTVQYIECDKQQTPVRAFVSLTPDREETGGGYREVVRVLANSDMRDQLLADARAEMDLFERKYGRLSELAEVFAAMRKAVRATYVSGSAARVAV